MPSPFSPTEDFAVGNIIGSGDSRYRIQAVLRSGEDGAVLRGSSTLDEASVVIKVPSRPVLAEREWNVLSNVRHHRIPVPLALITDPGRSVFVRQWVDGNTLDKTPLNPKDLVQLLDKLLEILEAFEQAGYFLCDLKPSDIVIDGRGEPWLIDFESCERGPRLDPDDIPLVLPPKLYHVPESRFGLGSTSLMCMSAIGHINPSRFPFVCFWRWWGNFPYSN
jgi:serine/threonine protein kinase